MCSTKWKCLWKRFIYSLTLVCLFLSLLNPNPTYAAPLPPKTPAPSAQPPEANSIKASQPTPPTPDAQKFEEARAKTAIEAAIQKNLDAWGPRYKTSPVEVTMDGDWAIGTAQWIGSEKAFEGPMNILAKRQLDGTWMAMLPDSSNEFALLVENAPQKIMSDEEKEEALAQGTRISDTETSTNQLILDAQNDLSISSTLSTPVFQWPTRGTIGTWIFGSNSGKHYGVDIIHPQDATLGDEVTVYPVYPGVIQNIWTDYGRKDIAGSCARGGGIKSVIVIYHSDINLYSMYFHMGNEATNTSYIDSNIYIGKTVGLTDRLGKMGNRVYNPCTDGESYGAVFHHHFAITNCATSGSCGIDPTPYFPGYQLNENQPNRTPIGTFVSPGSIPSSCSAPSLTSPGNDYVSPGNTITFIWNQTSCSNQNGYYLRVGTSNGASDVVSDFSVQGLQTNYSFGSQWYNRDLYWSVRANAPGAAWSSSLKFRIETGQNPGGCSSYITNFGFSPETPSNATSVSVHATISTSFPNFRAARLRVDNGGGFCEGSSYSYSCSNWDTRNLSDGDHTVVLEVDDNQGSSWDNPATCSRVYHLDPRPNPPPSAFNLISPSDGASFSQNDAVYLQWETSNGATQYMAHLWGDSVAERLSDWSSSTGWNAGQLTPGTYYWKVVAQNLYGVQESNQTRSFTVQQALPNAPSNLTAQAVSQSQINLSWSDNSSNETGFRLFREGVLVHTFGAGETSYQDTGLDCGRGYNYYIVAFNIAGQSGPSGSVGATTNACPPTVPPAPNPTSPNGTTFNCHDTITLSWNFIGVGVEYYIETWGANTKSSGPQESSLLYLGEQNSGQTFWHVRARYIGQSTYSSWGNTASFTVNSCPQFPDLKPFTPDGYEYPVVPSNIDGTHTPSILYANQPTYFDWNYINEGNGVASGTYMTEVWVDDHLVLGYPWQDFAAGQVWSWDDWQDTITATESQWHTIKMVTDSGNTIAESDETNNEWAHQFYWYLPSNDVHEPNDNVNNATYIEYGQTITAADIFPMGENDNFYFWGEANDVIIADVDAQAIGSRLDSVLELYDSDGTSLLLPPSDDVDGRDPKIVFTLPHDGIYYLLLKNYYNDRGGGDFYYQLKLTGGKQAPYMTDFETNTTGWATSGLWHEVDANSPYPMFASPSHSFWYGQDATGSYDTGVANHGDLTSPEIYIPTTENYYFRYKYWYETETQTATWDQRWVEYSIDDGPFYDLIQLQDDRMKFWHNSPVINLAGVGGHFIKFRFHFDTLDAAENAYRGWYIDDFSISTTPPPVCNDLYEPNDTIPSATLLAYGDVLNANICANGDTDYYQFDAQAGEAIVIDIDARVIASSLDSVVTLFNSNGEVLSVNDDDAMTYDSKLGYIINATGTYYIQVRDYWHPSNGGTDYNYSIHLFTDTELPSTAEITSPQNGAWISPTMETITANAQDSSSGIRRVEFLWHSADWENSDWIWLGSDSYGADGWTFNFDTSTLDEQAGGAVYIWAFDYIGNYSSAGAWNLGIDRTPPNTTLEISPMYGSAPFRDFQVFWSGTDNLSGVTSYDVQVRDGPSGSWQNIFTDSTGTYTRFVGEDGHSYYFRSLARDAAGNVGAYTSGDGQTNHTVQLCPVGADGYETDNTAATSRMLTMGSPAQSHNFHSESDQDWVMFTVQKDKVYSIVTENTGSHADTVLTLYDRDGTTELFSNDDYEGLNYASRIDWRPSEDGTYYAMINHWDPYGYGCTTAYTLVITDSSPTVSSVTPDSTQAGGGDITLVVNGANFIVNSVVRWDGVDLATTFVNSSQLNATLPANRITAAGTAQITVFDPAFGGLISNSVTFTITNPTPVLASISPISVEAGHTGFTLTATGSNFVTGSVIRWNGVELATSRVSSTQLTAMVDASRVSSVGMVNVTVYTPGPGGGETASRTFTITQPALILSSISPSSVTAGSGEFTLTATGSNFPSTALIQWNGNDLVTTWVSNTQLTANIEASKVAIGGTASVTVRDTAAGGVTSTTLTFTINNPVPVITNLNPSSAMAGDSEFTLTVVGNNLTPTSVVRWDGTGLTTTFVSNTQLTANIGSSRLATGGTHTITVFNPAPGGGTSTSRTLTVNNPAPILSHLNPTTVLTGGPAFTLTLTGDYFVTNSVVRWNGSALPTTWVSRTELIASVEAARIATGGTAAITVFNPSPEGGETTALTLAIDNPVPILTNMSPESGTVGSEGFLMTVNGSGFVPGSVIRWNGENLITNYLSSTQISTTIDAARVAVLGSAEITVFNSAPAGGESTPITFNIYKPTPVISFISPSSVSMGSEGFVLTVTGSHFEDGSVVRWNGIDLETTFISGNELHTQIDANRLINSDVISITVFNPDPDGRESSIVEFTISGERKVFLPMIVR